MNQANSFLGRWYFNVNPLGTLLVRLLKMIVVPVIFFSLIVGASSVHPKKLGRVGLKIFFFYIFTSATAVSIGLFIGNLFKPGLGLNLGSGSGKQRP